MARVAASRLTAAGRSGSANVSCCSKLTLFAFLAVGRSTSEAELRHRRLPNVRLLQERTDTFDPVRAHTNGSFAVTQLSSASIVKAERGLRHALHPRRVPHGRGAAAAGRFGASEGVSVGRDPKLARGDALASVLPQQRPGPWGKYALRIAYDAPRSGHPAFRRGAP